MATKSILKIVQIKDNKAADRLVNALENAGKKEPQPVTIKRKVNEASREDIRLMFGKR